MFEKPLISSKCALVNEPAPPKRPLYGRLESKENKLKNEQNIDFTQTDFKVWTALHSRTV